MADGGSLRTGKWRGIVVLDRYDNLGDWGRWVLGWKPVQELRACGSGGLDISTEDALGSTV